MYLKQLGLERNERRTFNLHLSYSVIEGFLIGVTTINDFILIKSLKGTDFQVGFLFQFSVIVLTFSVLFSEFLKRTTRKRRVLRYVGILTRLPLVAIGFFPAKAMDLVGDNSYQLVFLGAFFIYYLANPVVFPVINTLLKSNYRHGIFGKMYSYASTANKIVMMFTILFLGVFLDHDNANYIYIYPVMAVLGVVSIVILTSIKCDEVELPIRQTYWRSITDSGKNMLHILKGNKPFFDFEMGFMLYGFAFMSTSAVTTIFFDRVLDLNYSSVGFYKNAYNIIAILILPFVGRLMDKLDPRKVAIFAFSSMALHLFFLGMAGLFPTMYHDVTVKVLGLEVSNLRLHYMLVMSYLCYSFFAASMALLWSIGSAYFCTKEEAGGYQSVHLTLTGFRGILAPILGVALYEAIGYSSVFFIGTGLLLVGIVLMHWSMKYRKVSRIS